MKVTQAVFGVFHHFELAHQLRRYGHLQKIYSTWPWARLKREGLPRSRERSEERRGRRRRRCPGRA